MLALAVLSGLGLSGFGPSGFGWAGRASAEGKDRLPDGLSRPVAVRVAGAPVLQLCRDWLMWDSCRQYGRDIHVPDVVRTGDTFVIAFASNAKKIRFTVADILYADGECHLIRGSAPQNVRFDGPVDKLIIRDCSPLDIPLE